MHGETTNGTTFWVEAVEDTAVMALCNLSIDIGESTRVKDTERCLEDLGSGDLPGTNTEEADSTLEGYFIPDSSVHNYWAQLFQEGVHDGAAAPIDSFVTNMALATASGTVIPFRAWVHKYKLQSVSSDNKYKYRVTLAGQESWLDGHFKWDDAAAAPAGLEHFKTAIAAYYAAVNGASVAVATSAAATGSPSAKTTAVKPVSPSKK